MKEDLKFSDYPFIVPTEKRTINKLENLIQELKECGSAKTASLAIKHYNKYMDELQTQISIVYVLYSLDSTNKAYKIAKGTIALSTCNSRTYIRPTIKIGARAVYLSGDGSANDPYQIKFYG